MESLWSFHFVFQEYYEVPLGPKAHSACAVHSKRHPYAEANAIPMLTGKQLRMYFKIVFWALSSAAPLGQHFLTKHTLSYCTCEYTWILKAVLDFTSQNTSSANAVFSDVCCCCFQLVSFDPPGHKDKRHALQVTIHI